MNLAQIYSDATGAIPDEEAIKNAKEEIELAEQKAIDAQVRKEWLKLPQTATFLSDLETQADEFDKTARNFAMSYHAHKNSEVIVGALIQSSLIRNIIKYATRN